MEPLDKITTGPAYITHISPGADLNDIVFAGEFRIDTPEIDELSTYYDPDEHMTILNNAIGKEFEGVAMAARKLSKSFIIAAYYITAFYDNIAKNCPNRRVIHLALNARKERTRKKNWNRAMKILRRINNA